MSKRKQVIVATLTAAALAATAAYAKKPLGDYEIEPADLARAAISLYQAVAVAQQHTRGAAFSAELERDRRGLVYEVEILKDGAAIDVVVDAVDGRVLSAQPDNAKISRGKDCEDDD